MKPSILVSRKNTALAAAKRAVGRYARDPSESNAQQVSRAWHQLRQLTARTARIGDSIPFSLSSGGGTGIRISNGK